MESVKAITCQAPQIRDILVQLANSTEEAKAKSEAKSLAHMNLRVLSSWMAWLFGTIYCLLLILLASCCKVKT